MSKGGSSSSVEIPQYIEDAAKRNLARADTIGGLGYMPYYGPEVAAFTGMQNDAFANTNAAANAFGMQSSAGNSMPTPTTFADGSQGYSSLPLFDQAVADFRTARPGQAAAYDNLFIDPFTGQPTSGTSPVAPIIDPIVNPIIDPVTILPTTDNDNSKSVFDKNPVVPPVTQPVVPPVTQPVVPPVTQPVVPRIEFDPIKGEPIIADPVNEFLKNQSKFEKMADYQKAVDAIPIPPDEIIASQNILANDPLNENYNQNFQDVYDYQYQRSQNDDPDFPGMMTGTMITPEMLSAQGVDAYLPSPADLAGGLAASELSDVERGQVTANNIANSIFTLGGLLGGPSSAPLIQASSDGQERREMAVQVLVNSVEESGRNPQEIIDQGLLSGLGPSETSIFTNKYGSLASDQVAAQAIKPQKAFYSNDHKVIRNALESAGSDFGAYADAFKKSGAFTNPEHFQEKSGISPTTLASMRQVISAREGAA